MDYLEVLKSRKDELLTEIKAIDIIFGVHQKRGETIPGNKSNGNNQKLSPGVATQAFDILIESLEPMSIGEIYQELSSRGIKCKLDSVGQTIRRNKNYFLKAGENQWKAKEPPNEKSPEGSNIHGEVAEPGLRYPT